MPTKSTTMAHCSHCKSEVNLQQGFHQCITEHQCFSDDPCPLQGKFATIPLGKTQAPSATGASAGTSAAAPRQAKP